MSSVGRGGEGSLSSPRPGGGWQQLIQRPGASLTSHVLSPALPSPSLLTQVSAFPRPAGKDHVPGECGISFYRTVLSRGLRDASKNAANKILQAGPKITEDARQVENGGHGEGGADALLRPPQF